MEVKVTVDGVPRVVCGVTEETTCQEVVIALAQALGQPGRYTLRESFKDFQRCMTPSERLLETLEKYGEQAREVQLTLLHNGTPGWDDMSRTRVGRYQPCPPLRRKDAGTRIRRGSGSLTMHRRSLPPLSCSKPEIEQQKEDLKRPKRKSLTLMEEAWEWLESLGKGKVYSTVSNKESSKSKSDKKSWTALDVSLAVDKDGSGRSSRGKVRGQKNLRSDLDHQTSCCIGSQPRTKESKQSKKPPVGTSEDLCSSSCVTTEEEKNSLRESIVWQLSCLHDLQVQIAHIDQQIFQLEEKQMARKAEQEAQQRIMEEEMEQIKFWENELKAEEGHEMDLQRQFMDVKAKLEEYRCRMQGIDLFANMVPEDFEEVTGHETTTAGISAMSTADLSCQQSDPDEDGSMNRKVPPREEFNSPHALVHPSQIKERRPTGPTELREWWTRWSEAQSSPSHTKKKVIHRSELTIYLGSTKV